MHGMHLSKACMLRKVTREKKWYLKSPSSSLYVGENVHKQTVTKPADAGLFCFFAKRTCVSPAVVADQTAVLTDDSNVEEAQY